MKTVLILLVVIAVVGGAIGFYQGWFRLSSRSDNGKTNVMLSVDKNKIGADTDKAVDKVQDLGHQAADKLSSATQKARD